MKTINKVFFVLLILLAFSNPSLADLNKRYANSIQDAAVIEADEIVELKVINTPTAQVVTWTKYPDSFAPNSNANLQWGETWVTLNLDVQQHCKHFKRNKLNLRIQQLLGLPPVSNEGRFFVVLEAQTKDMFRPCANPSLLSDSCHAEFPDNISEFIRYGTHHKAPFLITAPKVILGQGSGTPMIGMLNQMRLV